MENLCNDCRFMTLKTTNFCIPYDYDERGNVIKCQSYTSIKKNIIMNVINWIKNEK